MNNNTNGGDENASVQEDEDRLSICSTVSGAIIEENDERPSSSLSISSTKGSRIPRLARSNSLKEKSHRHNRENLLSSSMTAGSGATPHESSCSSPTVALVRSQSFVSSRGMPGLMTINSSSLNASQVPVTSEQFTRRKFPSFSSSYVSPYSRRAIANERKNQVPQKDQIDSHASIENGGPRVVVHNCCGSWQGPEVSAKRSNVVHCSHRHENNDDYLTPTQRATVKIRELQGRLTKARKEIAVKDHQISILNKDLAEKRLHKVPILELENIKTNLTKEESHLPLIENIPHLRIRSFSPSGEGSSVSPNSDECELDLKSFPKHKGDSISPSPPEDSDFGEPSRSLADSGHYEDLPSPCRSPRDSMYAAHNRKLRNSTGTPEQDSDDAILWAALDAAEEGVRTEFNRRVEILKENHMEEYQEVKERHNDRVEMLLSKLSDANLRYFELRPQYDKAQDQIRDLEKTVSSLKDELDQNQLRQQKVYLQMYLKGQQAAKFQVEENMNSSKDNSPHSSDPDVEKLINDKLKTDDPLLDNNVIFTLMKQLAHSEEQIQKLKVQHQNEESTDKKKSRRSSTFSILRNDQIDPGITLQFLKSAIYYFLTDKDNAQGHLRAIESILGYTTMERGNINRYTKH